MKNIITTLSIIILLFTACAAQQPVAKISSNKVSLDKETYNISKSAGRYTEIKNSANKFGSVKQSAPNLPSDFKVSYNMSFDKKLVYKICADAIPLEKLKEMPMGMNDRLTIYMKVDGKGVPIEMEFVVQNTSLISAKELQQIEINIKKQVRITFLNGIDRYFKGANFFNIDIPVPYSEILKAH